MEEAYYEEHSLESLRHEMRSWKEKEFEKKRNWNEQVKIGEPFDPHAELINPKDLTDEDRMIWEKFKNETLTREDLKAYSEKLVEEIRALPNQETRESRSNFLAMITNASYLFLYRKDKNKTGRKE